MTGFIVKARYQPKMDEKREQRIHAAFERCDVKVSRFALPSVIEDDAVQVHFSDVDWVANEDGTETQLEIYVGDVSRATRVASELRACGMVVGMRPAE